MQEWLAGAQGFEPRYGDFEMGFSRLFERRYRTPFNWNCKPLENTRILRTVLNPRSPELRIEMSQLEKNNPPLRIGSPELKSQIAANTELNCPQSPAENIRLRPRWRRERDSNSRMRSPSKSVRCPRPSTYTLAMSSRVATQWRFWKRKSRPHGRLFAFYTEISVCYLGCGIGFEPMTFRL
jgi:hypothetical protein